MKKLIALFLIASATSYGAGFTFFSTGQIPVEGTTQLTSGRQSAVALPGSLVTDEMYMAWPENATGFGEPFTINQTEAWWVGPDVVSTGGVFSVYGRNLELGGDGLTQLYMMGASTNLWLTNNGTANPYKVDFTVPDDLPNGTYTNYIHNGHGKEYGWGDALTLTVVDAIEWTATVIDVTVHGANGADELSDQAEILAAYSAAGDYGTVHLPAGTYYVTNLWVPNPRKWLGDGVDGTNKTIIAGMDDTITIDTTFPYGVLALGSNAEVKDIELNTGNGHSTPCFILASLSTNLVFNNVRFDGVSEKDGSLSGIGSIHASYGRDVTFSGCEFIESGEGGFYGENPHFYWKGCNFIGMNDANTMIVRYGDYFSLDNCTAGALDTSSHNTNTWCKGRWISGGKKRTGFAYFGDNVSSNMHMRSPTPEYTNTLSAVSNTAGTVSYAIGTKEQYSMQFPTNGLGLLNSGYWPDATKFSNTASGVVWELSQPIDYETGWCTIWYDGSVSPGNTNYANIGDSFVVSESVDGNAGEQFMFEGLDPLHTGYATSIVDASNFSIIGLGTDYSSDGVFSITEGTGSGQHAEIESINAGTGQIVLKKPLRVTPDATSLCKIGEYIRHMAFYNNKQGGHSSYIGRETATCSVNCYGAALAVCIDGNTSYEMDGGFEFFSQPNTGAGKRIMPTMFNYVANNTIHSVRNGLVLNAIDFGGTSSADEVFFGNLFRDNIISNTTTAVEYGTGGGEYRIDMNLFQENIFKSNTAITNAEAGVYNQIWINNTNNGVAYP